MDAAFARALHLPAVVVWIGAVAMVPLTLLPAIRRGELGLNPLSAFKRRLSSHARMVMLIAGLTGLYMQMLDRLDSRDRFKSIGFWWMHAMLAVWTLPAPRLFVIEPIVVYRRFGAAASRGAPKLLAVARALGLGPLAIFGTDAGSPRWSIW